MTASTSSPTTRYITGWVRCGGLGRLRLRCDTLSPDSRRTATAHRPYSSAVMRARSTLRVCADATAARNGGGPARSGVREVAPTGVDPVTSRFSVRHDAVPACRKTNLTLLWSGCGPSRRRAGTVRCSSRGRAPARPALSCTAATGRRLRARGWSTVGRELPLLSADTHDAELGQGHRCRVRRRSQCRVAGTASRTR